MGTVQPIDIQLSKLDQTAYNHQMALLYQRHISEKTARFQAILKATNYHELVIGSVANIDLKILLPFGIGCIASLLIMPKFINYLLAEYKLQVMTFFASLILVSGVITSPFMSL